MKRKYYSWEEAMNLREVKVSNISCINRLEKEIFSASVIIKVYTNKTDIGIGHYTVG